MKIEWLLYAPQYHFLILVLVLICLAVILDIYRIVRKKEYACPCCHKRTVVQYCANCKFIRVLRED